MRPILLFALLAAAAPPRLLEREAAPFAADHVDAEPATIAETWLAPFDTPDRTDLRTLRAVSSFGAGRVSYWKGHLHTATDLVPARARGHVVVRPLAPGVVVSVHLAEPHRTVVVKHRLPDGSALWTSYKHLQSTDVKTGAQVDATTRLGRLYTPAEARALGANYDHLHLEVRRAFDDHGAASWATLTREELDRRFVDPWPFLRAHLRMPLVLVVNAELDPEERDLAQGLARALHRVRPLRTTMVHVREATPDAVRRLAPAAIAISGQTVPWRRYPPADLAGVERLLRETKLPTLGVCGGHQLLALAFGAAVAPRSPVPADSYDGCDRHEGVVAMRVVRADPLLAGVGASPRFYVSHCEEVRELPRGFVLLASAEGSRVQAMRHAKRPLWGVQFHPELEPGASDGLAVLRAFAQQLPAP